MAKGKEISTFFGITVILSAAVIIFSGVFTYEYFGIKELDKMVDEHLAKQTTGFPIKNLVTEGWKAYKSGTYDYEIEYPIRYETSENNAPVSPGILGTDIAGYVDKNYDTNFQIFARNGFVLDGCLKDLSGENITKTVDINDNKFYAYVDQKRGTGGRMALAKNAIQSEYHIIHDNYCYIIIYTVTPTYPDSLSASELEQRVNELEKIFHTFKFTK
jgi:hypothetical protein